MTSIAVESVVYMCVFTDCRELRVCSLAIESRVCVPDCGEWHVCSPAVESGVCVRRL